MISTPPNCCLTCCELNTSMSLGKIFLMVHSESNYPLSKVVNTGNSRWSDSATVFLSFRTAYNLYIFAGPSRMGWTGLNRVALSSRSLPADSSTTAGARAEDTSASPQHKALLFIENFLLRVFFLDILECKGIYKS